MVHELLASGLSNTWIRYLNTLACSTPLIEGEHYVVCRECKSWHACLTPKHLHRCSGITLGQYRAKHPNHNTNCRLLSERKKKTEAQKRAQSEKLKTRFQTPQGQITRQQISEASKRMQASGYRERAAEHLRSLNKDPQQRQQRAVETKALWASSEHRAKVAAWHQEHRDEVLESARNARDHLTSTSKLHLRFKAALDKVVLGFITEYKIGWYSIDEARPDLKIAVEIDGCYWHGCEVCGFPGTKRIQNIDTRKSRYLLQRGWAILRVPEHEISADVGSAIERVRQFVGQRVDVLMGELYGIARGEESCPAP